MTDLIVTFEEMVQLNPWNWMAQVFFFLLGTCLGSFTNVCIWRMPRGETVVTTPSHCILCNYNIHWYDNIPLLSWLVLRGRCRNCGVPISMRYFWIELLTGILVWLVWTKYAVYHHILLEAVPLYILLVWLCIATFFIDLKHRIIPNELTYTVLLFALIWAPLAPELWRYRWEVQSAIPWTHGLMRAAFAASLFGVGMWCFALFGETIFKREALGWGDIKFCAAAAACVGIEAMLYVLIVASVLGVVFGLYVALRRYLRGRRRRLMPALPFGVFLAIGVVSWILAEEGLIASAGWTMPFFDWVSEWSPDVLAWFKDFTGLDW